jgi:drug/metabolite transporter (DMT)-like permease
MALAAAGVLLLISEGTPARLVNLDFAAGDLIMLLATVVFGAYTVLVGCKPAELPITAFVFSTFALCLVMLLPAYLVELSLTGPFTVDRSTTAALLYIGIFPSLLAFSLGTEPSRPWERPDPRSSTTLSRSSPDWAPGSCSTNQSA